MIPSIETIVEDVVMGRITKSQAVTWLLAHAEGAANDLRDHFAASALQGIIRHEDAIGESEETVAKWSYAAADAMIEARKAK